MLQSGDAETLLLWKKLVSASTRYFNTIYDSLGVTLRDEHIAGESLYNPWLSQVVDDLTARNFGCRERRRDLRFSSGFLGRDQQALPLIIRKQEVATVMRLPTSLLSLSNTVTERDPEFSMW